MYKTCSKCKENKGLGAFPNDKKRKDGLHPYCRKCVSAASKAYYEANLEVAREKRRLYDALHVTEKNARTAAWRKANPEQHAATRRKQREARYDEIRAMEKARITANPERVRENARRAYQRNIVAERARHKKHCAANLDQYARRAARRRAAVKQVTMPWEEEFMALVEREAFALAGARKECTGVCWHVDHIIPIAGKLVTGLHVWNNIRVVPARLNQMKYNNFDESLLRISGAPA